MNLTKRKPYRNKAITKAANGEPCTLCSTNDGTTVFCHINESWAGKGIGQKADDCAGFFGCYMCHAVYDGRVNGSWFSAEDILEAYYKTIRRLIDKGVLK